MPVSTIVRSNNTLASESEITAVIYLRVSSPGQLTGHNPEGYSIDGQRKACERYAASLGARVVREYIEPGKTATNVRRQALQQMLAELGEVRPTYVIFYDLSRVARDEPDAFWLLGQVRSHGAKLTSTREPVDDSPQGLLLFAIMAGVNAFRSRDDGEKVKLGLERKHADGGSHGPARLGYLNTRESVAGREVATISIDPQRVHYIRLAFDTFATGEHTLTTVTELLEDAGLRTRPTATRPSRPLSRASLHRILRDDYYIGVVTRDGVKREGRHEAIIDRDTFERVQHVLDVHRATGDRSHKHVHYLARSVFCGVCGRRLGYGRHRSSSGQHYEYFSCLSRVAKTGRCEAPYFRVHQVERGIERKYKTLLLNAREQAILRKMLRAHVQINAETARAEADRHARRLRELVAEQQALVQLYYKKGVSEEVLIAEQERIQAESAAVERWSTAAKREVEDVDQALSDALALIDLGTAPYLVAQPLERRIINLAIYLALLVSDPDTIEAKPSELYALLVPLARQLAQETAQDGQNGAWPDPESRGNQPRNDHDPAFRGRSSQSMQMAGWQRQSSKTYLVWKRISELHAQRFGKQ
jgi:site-specific DNA recombinase